MREHFVVALPKEHRVTARRVSLADLRDEPFILVRRPSAPGMYAQVLESCRAVGFEPVVAAEVGRMLTALGLVAAGLGLSLVPKSVAALRPPGVRFAALIDQAAPWAPLTLTFRAGENRPVVTDLLATTRSRGRKPSALTR